MTREYLVVYELANGSYSGYAPDLPGCITTGNTHEEIRENMRAGVENHVGSLVMQGAEVPSAVVHIIQCPKPVRDTDVQHWIAERMKIEIPVSSAS
jgi:predicted RNase H-like HicB family nuclease